MLTEKNKDLEEIRETLLDSDFVLLRILLKCGFDAQDNNTKNAMITFMESNNKMPQFIESLLSNLRDPKSVMEISMKEQPNEVMRQDREDTWLISSFLKRISFPYLKETVISIISSIEKQMRKVEEMSDEQKSDKLFEKCEKFISMLTREKKLLPKMFYSIMRVLKKHYPDSYSDAIVSILFLRIIYPAFISPESFFLEDSKRKSKRKNFNFPITKKKNQFSKRKNKDSFFFIY